MDARVSRRSPPPAAPLRVHLCRQPELWHRQHIGPTRPSTVLLAHDRQLPLLPVVTMTIILLLDALSLVRLTLAFSFADVATAAHRGHRALTCRVSSFFLLPAFSFELRC